MKSKPSRPRTFSLSEYQFERLELFLTSEPGWCDGEGRAANRKTVAEALQVLQYLRDRDVNRPSLVMGSSGDIAIMIQSRDRAIGSVIEVIGDGQCVSISWLGEAFKDYPFHAADNIPADLILFMRKLEAQEEVKDGKSEDAAKVTADETRRRHYFQPDS
jgi:hypothetical protein